MELSTCGYTCAITSSHFHHLLADKILKERDISYQKLKQKLNRQSQKSTYWVAAQVEIEIIIPEEWYEYFMFYFGCKQFNELLDKL